MTPAYGAAPAAPRHLVVGHIAKAHGTRGEVFIAPLTDHPDTVFAPGQLLLLGDDEGTLGDDAPALAVGAARRFKRGLLVTFVEVAGRADAEAIARRYLFIPADTVAPLEEGELFYHELLGMRVETVGGSSAGTVREVFETEPHHLLEVVGEDGRRRLIPFAARIVRTVDRSAGRLVIDPPDGLLEL